MKLTEIWIYPVKSLGGIRLNKSTVLRKGLQYDRRYMLVDDNYTFITQRAMPELSLFKLSFHDDGFLISHKNESLVIPFEPAPQKDEATVTIWGDTVKAWELGESYNQWFSSRLNIKCKLVYFPEENQRLVDRDFAKNNEQVSFADGYPFLIIGRASLDVLNSKLAQPVPMNRFRPNFVFEGGKPFEEDTWTQFKVGSNRFMGLKLCARCVLTTVNQDTGEKGVEPLATLSTFRKEGSKVNFGQNLVAIDHLEVRQGDEIIVETYQ